MHLLLLRENIIMYQISCVIARLEMEAHIYIHTHTRTLKGNQSKGQGEDY